MDWEAPVPVWIEPLCIDKEMVDAQQSLYPDGELFTTITERDSICMKLDVDDITPIVESVAVKSFALFTTPSSSPVKAKPIAVTPAKKPVRAKESDISPVKTKPSAKPSRPRYRTTPLDPTGREERRKSKQRVYEKTYRTRRKQTREEVEDEWVQLETCMREILSKRTVVVNAPSPASEDESKFSVCERYHQLLVEERVLREAEAFDTTFLAWYQALDFFGGEAKKKRSTRAKVNALPALRTCHVFEFSW